MALIALVAASTLGVAINMPIFRTRTID